jgi:hypothetical protein
MKWPIAAILLTASVAAAEPVELDGLRSEAPWETQPASSGMRKYQFKIPPEKGDAHPTELVIFFFGKGQGGDAQGNIARWRGMFEKAPEPKVTEETIAGARATIMELSGTYLFRARPMDPGPPEPRPDHRMIGVHFATPNGPYFMRLVGPDATVSKHKADFLKFLRGFKPAR